MWKYFITVVAALCTFQTASAKGVGAGFFVETSVGGHMTELDEDYYYMDIKQEPFGFDLDGFHGQVGFGYEFELAPGTDLRFTGYAEANTGEKKVYEDEYEKEFVEIKNGFGARASVRFTMPDQRTFFGGHFGGGVVEFCKRKEYSGYYDDDDYYIYESGPLAYASGSPVMNEGGGGLIGESGTISDCDDANYWEVGGEFGRNFMDNKVDAFARIGYREYSDFGTSFEPDFPERHEFSANGTVLTLGVTYRFGTMGA